MHRFRARLLLVPAACWLLVTAASATSWKPLEEGLLEEAAGAVDPEADAEAVFWSRTFDGERIVTTVRLKLYTERGVEAHATLYLPPSPQRDAPFVWGRTIRPDGTILELDPDTVFLDDVIAQGRDKLRGRTVTMPGVVPGAVLDYEWVDVSRRRPRALPLQLDIPVRRLEYHVKGAPGAQAFLSRPVLEARKRGNFTWLDATVTNVPALREEPFDPPLSTVLPWLWLDRGADELPRFVRDAGLSLAEETNGALRPSKALEQAALSVAADDVEPVEAMDKLCEWVRREVQHEEGRRTSTKLTFRTAKKILERRSGDGLDMALLTVALARARDLDARLNDIR